MQPKKLDSISSLRGLAALYVAMLHLAFGEASKMVIPEWLKPAIVFGNVGVTLFFVLSAFTLSMSMEARRTESSPIISFYVRRIFRIAPLFYISAIASFVVGLYLFNYRPTTIDVLLNISFLFNFVPGHEWSIAYAGWSVGTEMAFYTIFPLVFMTTRSWRGICCWLLITLAIAQSIRGPLFANPTVHWPFPYTLILNQMPVFVIGMATYRVYKLVHNTASARRIGMALVAASLVGAYLMAYPFMVDRVGSSLYLRAILCGMFLLGVVLSPIKIIVNRFSGFFGEISYSVYLTHVFCCLIVQRIAVHYMGHFPSVISFAISYVLLLAIVLTISYVTYRFIEEPFNALGKAAIAALRSFRGLAA